MTLDEIMKGPSLPTLADIAAMPKSLKEQAIRELRDAMNLAQEEPSQMPLRDYGDSLDQQDYFGIDARDMMASFINARHDPAAKAASIAHDDKVTRDAIKGLSGMIALTEGRSHDLFGEPVDNDLVIGMYMLIKSRDLNGNAHS
jgi:hypothetical protein